MNILFSGYYGHDNMGDDAFGLVSILAAKMFWNENEVALLSNKGPVLQEHDIVYVLPKKSLFKGFYTLYSLQAILRTKLFVFSGGSILHSKSNIMSMKGILFILLKLQLIKVGAIGVSIGPFKEEEDYKYIEKQLKKFKFLVLRDRNSFDIALSMNLPFKPVLGADLAFLLPDLTNFKLTNSKKELQLLGISLCHFERYTSGDLENEKRREKLFLDVLFKVLEKSNIKLRFFIINGNNLVGDRELTKEIINKLKLKKKDFEIIEYTNETKYMLKKISECSTMFTTRLHGAIFAASVNTTSILVEYHPKCTDYLNDIGIDVNWRIGDMDIKTEIIRDKILSLLDKKNNNFYPYIDRLRILSKKNFMNSIYE